MDAKICQEDVDRMFSEGLSIIVMNWPVVKLIIQNGWVGKNEQKIRDDPEAKQLKMETEYCKSESQVINDFIEDLFKYVLSYDCKNEDLEDWLLKEIEDRFYTIIEDHSQRDIANVIIELFNELEEGKFKVYEDIKKMGATMKSIKVAGQCGNKEDDDDDSEDGEGEGEDWEDSSQIHPGDIMEPELTEEELKIIEEEKAEQERRKQLMEDDGFSVVVNKKKK